MALSVAAMPRCDRLDVGGPTNGRRFMSWHQIWPKPPTQLPT
jgi:hypothetical protein